MKLLRPTALLASVAAGAALVGTATTVASAAPASGPDRGPCPENAAVECATVTVPVD
ncbi:hypothetical protein [Actinophytocola sp.]|uniref:hypothetical protein n=1 Tax=Actinophytocola sp. TaxID=1872138 RepID=UPI003D6C5DF1